MNRSQYNRFCKSLPVTTHVVQWGNSDVWKVGGKVFAICNGEKSKLPGITFKVTPMAYEMLQSLPGLRPAPYLASRGMKWIQRHGTPGLDIQDLKAYLAASHALVADGLPQKTKFALGLFKPPTARAKGAAA